MRVEIKMANLGYDMETGKIGSWLKGVGDSVQRGEPVVEVETDKSSVEMESLHTGTLVELVHAEGDEVAVGDVIGYIETAE
jgi:pyruvate/2-oxoglutarate dehydrogenase complex dihydrolipoamide acyltransferase (E2) component